MTRIGKVVAFVIIEPGAPCFQLVIENGRVVLGCWHAIAYEYVDWSDGKGEGRAPRAIWERVS